MSFRNQYNESVKHEIIVIMAFRNHRAIGGQATRKNCKIENTPPVNKYFGNDYFTFDSGKWILWVSFLNIV